MYRLYNRRYHFDTFIRYIARVVAHDRGRVLDVIIGPLCVLLTLSVFVTDIKNSSFKLITSTANSLIL